MIIRNAQTKDIPGVLRILRQVLEIHAAIRPDIFISGTTKYTAEDLVAIFSAEDRLTFVAVDNADTVLGYAFCVLQRQPDAANLVPFTSLYIDDLCVDAAARGRHIGTALFERVKTEAKARSCYEITLNVWEGNDAAKRFYETLGMQPKETRMEFIIDRQSDIL